MSPLERVSSVLHAPSPGIPLVLGSCASGRTTLLKHLLSRLEPETVPLYLDLERVATTPEQCYRSLLRHVRPAEMTPALPAPADLACPRDAFLAMLRLLTQSTSASGRPFTFLLDEVLELRTFESFPGLKTLLAETGSALAISRNRFVLTSRFANRAVRLLMPWPQVVVLNLDGSELASAPRASSSLDGLDAYERRQVLALTAGRLGYAVLVGDALKAARRGGIADPVGALTEQMLPGAALERRVRLSYEIRLQRARGYGALRAILDVLADQQPMNLTQIARRMHRSTKDYLSWMLDVDLLTVEHKRYTIADPLLRLWLRLNNGVDAPAEQAVAREVQRFAAERLASLPAEVVHVAVAARPASGGIIEID
jgi:hypothetical protein